MTDDEKMDNYNKGFKAGTEHQHPSDETIRMHNEVSREVMELKNEWVTFKSRALKILLGSSAVLVGYGMWVGTIQSFVTEHGKWADRMEIRVVEIDRRQQSADVTNAEIKTKLVGIEASLVEIKNALKIR